MNHQALIWLLCNLFSIVVLAFYSMAEMAWVSFNKVRLQYYVSKGVKRALWLNYLLQNPSRLFGTTLIAVNIALIVGSECSREFHSALGINPDLSPLTQVIVVVIFGELAPMFAARHYAEHVAMLTVPFVYLSAKLMKPLLWGVGLISKLCNFLVGGRESLPNIYLTQEELQKILEEQEEDQFQDKDSEEFNAIAANIFNLRTKDAKQVMEPLSTIPALPSNATIAQVNLLLAKTKLEYIPIYHRDITNIIGIAIPRDLIRAPDTRRVRDYARPPWFVTENTNIKQILKQFRHNNQSVAVILNQQGKAIGMIHLDDVLEEIFGKSTSQRVQSKLKKLMIIERTFPGEMKVADFNAQFGVILDPDDTLTLSQLLTRELGHHPEKGESIYLSPFELTVKETSLLEVKSISILTKMK
jgi:putative hemolysin